MQRFLEALEQRPVIAAIRNMRDLPVALQSPVPVVFFLAGTIFNLSDAVAQVRNSGKLAFVHIEMLQGLSKDDVGLQYLASAIRPDGIITTRSSTVAAARERGLLTVQRTFLLDSQSVATGIQLVREGKPDVLEVLPGIIPGELQEIVRKIKIPLITGGLIKTVAQCRAALRAGASGVSTSRQDLWTLTPREQHPHAGVGGKEVEPFSR